MTYISKQVRGIALVAVGILFAATFVFAPHITHAQEEDFGSSDVGCCSSDFGSSFYSPDSTDFGSSYYSPDTTGTTDFGSSYYSPDTTDFGSSYYSPNDVTDTYGSTDIYGNTTIDESGVGYSYQDYANGYSNGGYSSGYSAPIAHPFAIVPPVYSTPVQVARPVTVATPIPVSQPVRPIVVQQPAPQPQPVAPQPINIVNNNTNTNVNTNVPAAAPVYQAPVQIPVVYAPQPPVYLPPVIQNVSCVITTTGNGFLTWSSYGASYATLSNGIGNVAPNGSMAVNPGINGTYVLTVYGSQGQSASCNTYVTVPNMTPVVSLTQIPYTGFDFGPMDNAIYWMSLLAFAVAGAYLVVYYRGGALALAGQMMGSRKQQFSQSVSSVTQQARKAVETIQSPVTKVASIIEDKIVSPVTSSLNLPIAENRKITTDAMIVKPAHGSEAPRIVISRS